MTVSGSRAFVYSLFQDIVLLGSIILAVWIRYRIEPFVFGESGEPLSVFVVFLIFKASFHYFNLYQVNLHLSLREFVSRLLAVNIVSLVLLTILYYSYPPLIIGRGILAFCVVSVIFSTSLYRGLWSALSRDVAFSKNVLILGDERAARVVVEEIEDYRHSGYRVVGLISGKAERVGEDIARGRKIIGTNADMRRICDEEDIDLIIVALEESRGNLPVNELMDLKVLGVQIVESTDFHEQFRGKIVLEGLRASWFIFSDGFVVGRFST
ncbi:MAG: hypothetical protein M5R36_24250 [Deltaproteobacteria bacterium]|nr:hypothetical protein [Deltaproteobacteria bacterium]